jgi:hypothetical protein
MRGGAAQREDGSDQRVSCYRSHLRLHAASVARAGGHAGDKADLKM